MKIFHKILRMSYFNVPLVLMQKLLQYGHKKFSKKSYFCEKKIANICNMTTNYVNSACQSVEFFLRSNSLKWNLIKLTNRQQESHVRSLHSKPNNEEVTFVGNTRHLTNGWLKYEVKEARAEKRRKNKATGSCERNSSRLTQLKPTLPQCERNIGS